MAELPYDDPDNLAVEGEWLVDVADTPDRYIVTYTCPICHTEWSMNLALDQTSCELYCNLEGNKAQYTLPPTA